MASIQHYILNTETGEDRMNELIEIAIERIRHFEPKEGYYLAFSGGKEDHPRVCGKDSSNDYEQADLMGSPPRVRERLPKE